MKDNVILPRKDLLKHTATVRDIAVLCRMKDPEYKVSTQQILKAIKNKKWEEKGIAKKIGHQWMLLPEAADIIIRRKGKVGNPNMIKGKPNIYTDKIRKTLQRRAKENPRKIGSTHKDRPDKLPTGKKKKESVIEGRNPVINKKVRKHIENKGETSIFLDEE